MTGDDENKMRPTLAAVISHWTRQWAGLRRKTAAPRRLFLHAGLHKTGTTAVQTMLAAGAGRLRKHKLLYPEAGRPEALDGHHNIPWQLAGDRRFRAAFGSLDDVAAEIARFPGDAILSSEDFESLLDAPEQLQPLVRHPALRDREITLLIYVRDQASYAESLFLELLRHEMTHDARRFCDDVLARGEVRFREWVFHFDYDALRTCILRAGIARLEIRPYAMLAGASTVTDLLRVAGRSATAIGAAARRANERDSLTQSLARFCAHRLGREIDVIERRLDALLGARLARRRAHLSTDRRRAFRRRFAEGNGRFAQACGLSGAALDANHEPPPDSLDMETLFSNRTVDTVRDWLDGTVSDQQAAALLLTGSAAPG